MKRFLRGCMLAMAVGSVTVLSIPSSHADEAAAATQDTGPKFDDVVKDLKKVTSPDGTDLMTLYVGASDSKNSGKLLAAVPKGLIGKDLLLAISISRGPEMGNPAGGALVRWQQIGDQLILSMPDVRQKQNPGKAVNGAVENTYTSSFLASLPILCKDAAGDPVVDLGSALQAAGMGMSSNYTLMPRPDLTVYQKVKVFPENVLVDLDLAFATRTGEGSTIGIGFSLRSLPDIGSSDFKPREADERVGYFTTVREDWNSPYTSREIVQRYIDHWNLEKNDATLDLSPPKKPIVFVIEKTVPLQWRRYVAEGILEWNKAFEQCGITGAIVVQQQTDDNEFANVDPEDARYNFFRWIVTGQGFAMGPHRSDPRTGEILDADIIFDDSMVRDYESEYRLLFGPDAMAMQFGPEVISFMEKNPSFIPMGMTKDEVEKTATAMRRHAMLGSGEADALRDEVSMFGGAGVKPDESPLFHPAACTYAQGVRQEMAMLKLMMAESGGRKVPDRLLGQMIKHIVSHEVGHTLGLRHNFKGSAWLSPDEIKKRRDANDGQPLTGSVMDYNADYLFAGDKLESIKEIASPTIGPYDYWAIQYGYKSIDADEKAELNKIASRSNESGLAYETDEDVMGMSSPDPLANRWDMSSDPIGWAAQQSKLAEEMLADFDKWAVGNDEPQYFLRSAYLNLLFEKTRDAAYVSRFVGGQYFNRNRAGDPNAVAPLTIVDAATQRKALDTLASTVFNDDFVQARPDLLNRMAVSRNWDSDNDFPAARVDFPIHQAILSMQSSALFGINNPVILQRVYDAELKNTANDKFTAAELLGKTKEIVWGKLEVKGDAFTDAKPMISSIRRNLQKQWLNNMLAMAKSEPGSMMSADLQNMVRYGLRELSEEIGETMKSKDKLDFATKAHLVETKSRIDRVLDAPEIDMQMPDVGIYLSGQKK